MNFASTASAAVAVDAPSPTSPLPTSSVTATAVQPPVLATPDLPSLLHQLEAQAAAMLTSGRSDLPMDQVWQTVERIEFLANQLQGKGWGGITTREVALICLAFDSLARRAPRLAIDIGGNIGDYTDALRRQHPQLEVHVFEPSATNVAKLQTRFAADSGIRIVPKAVARETGAATLFSNTPGSVLGSLSQRKLAHANIEFSSSESIETVRFEDYWRDVLGQRDIDLVKVDVEGHELAVLEGFGQALNATRMIQFEFGGTNIDTRTFFQDFWYLLTGLGFEIFRITPLGLQRISRYRENEESFLFMNYLAINRARFGAPSS